MLTKPTLLRLVTYLKLPPNTWLIKMTIFIIVIGNPNFVVYLGDVITKNNILIKNATKYWENPIFPASEDLNATKYSQR